MKNEILVTIGMATYNHERYVSQAIESVLEQKVNFKYEIIIADDCSEDNTQNIIIEYSKKYPKIITCILRERNVGAYNNFKEIKEKSQGKYYITLEGDDYWINSQKLQIQVDFLETHKEYIGVSHWCELVDQDNNISIKHQNKYKVFNFKGREYRINDFKKNRIPGHTTTLLHRNIYKNQKVDYLKIFEINSSVGDRTLFLILTLLGKIYCIHSIMSHYRYISIEGGSSYSSKIKNKNLCYSWYKYYSDLEISVKKIMQKKISLRYLKYNLFVQSSLRYKKNPNKENYTIRNRIFDECNEKFLMILYYYIIINIKKIKKRILSVFYK